MENSKQNGNFYNAIGNKLLRSLVSSMSAGNDGIASRLPEEALAYIAAPLCRLFELSLESGSQPYDLTLTHIVAMHKKGDKQLLQKTGLFPQPIWYVNY